LDRLEASSMNTTAGFGATSFGTAQPFSAVGKKGGQSKGKKGKKKGAGLDL